MSGQTDLLTQRLLAALDTIPAGRVASRRTLARHLGTLEQHVARLILGLAEGERAAHPWHRVVADGGAVGRHARRDEQIARLRAEGVGVAPAGIVDGFRERRIDTFVSHPPVGPAPPPPPSGSRARGMKGRPQSTT